MAETTDEPGNIEARRRFKIELGEALRGLTRPAEIMAAVADRVGPWLCVDQANYYTIEGEEFVVGREWRSGASHGLLGRHRLAEYGEGTIARMRAGEVLRLDDTQGREGATAFAERAMGAVLSVPLQRDGQWVAGFHVHQAAPRRWTDDEVALVREVAAHAWSAVERGRAQTFARESEARYRAMADLAPVMTWVTDPSGRCVYLNRAWYHFTGQTPEEAEGFGWLDATHPDDQAEAKRIFATANAAREGFRLEYRLRRADGSYAWAIDAASPRFGADGEYLGYIGSVFDIDERRAAEEALRESETRLRLAVDNAEIGFWDVDPVNDLLIWPPRTKAMFGISPDVEVSLDDFYSGLHPDDFAKTSAAYHAATDPAKRELYDVEYRTVGKEDGVVRWVAAKGRGLFDGEGPEACCLRVVGTAIDITARKAGEQALRELNETLEARVAERTAERDAVWRTSQDLIVVIRAADGIYVNANPAWTEELGYPLDQVFGRSLDAFVHPGDRPLVMAGFARMQEGQPFGELDVRLRGADGTYRTFAFNLRREGDLLYAFGRDVSGRRALEEQLRQSQKMEAVGQLTGGVAHDFNNLLTPIVGALDLLQRKGVGDLREQRLIAGAAQSAERAKTLVQRLLAFARRQPLQPSAVAVDALVRGMHGLLETTTGPQIRLVLDVEDQLPPAQADANQLEMALLNLGVNARDAMPDGGTLRVSARAAVASDADAVEAGRYVVLSVADTGVGMDTETVARAIEPFFSTKGIGKGTGLGLSMVHGLAKQLGGELLIHSRRGVGTNIELWLPVADAGPADARAASGAQQPDAASGTVLLVDDEDVVRAVAADMLGDLGYHVVEATSAEAAWAAFERGAAIDFVVTDHLMPGQSGTDLARRLRAARPELPVLIVSGYAEVEGVAPDLPRLSKPFRRDELAAAVAELRGG